MPYLLARVDTVLIPVVVQQPPTLAQRCQILHNRVQSFFFICKIMSDNWSKEGSLLEVQSENAALQTHFWTRVGQKTHCLSFPAREAFSDYTTVPTAHHVLEIQVSSPQVREILRKARGRVWVTIACPAQSSCWLPMRAFGGRPIGQMHCLGGWIQLVRYRMVLYEWHLIDAFQDTERSCSRWCTPQFFISSLPSSLKMCESHNVFSKPKLVRNHGRGQEILWSNKLNYAG